MNQKKQNYLFLGASFIISLILYFYVGEGNDSLGVILIILLVLPFVLFVPGGILGAVLMLLIGKSDDNKNMTMYATAALIICSVGYFYGISQKIRFESHISNCLNDPEYYNVASIAEHPKYIYKECIEEYKERSDYERDRNY